MKILLMAFRYGPSHGSILQTYALTRTLEHMGHQVTIINRQRPANFLSFKTCVVRVVSNLFRLRLSRHDFYLVGYPPVMKKEINKFIKKELTTQTITTSSDKKLRKIGRDDYDAYIVGSDQTWRPKYVHNIYDFFLAFVPEERSVKRIAYAPSFGTADWVYTPEQESRCKALLSLFDRVSVREDDGVKLCKEHFGVNAVLVLDPSMLLTGEDYMKHVKIDTSGGDYLASNFLDIDDWKQSLSDKVSRMLDIPGRQILSMSEVKRRVAPSIEDWLSGIANSRFAIVDSFHATVFCVLFHKSFITVGNATRGLSRFTSLLGMLGLSDRLVIDGQDTDEKLAELVSSPIDWDVVDEKLNAMREKSLDFLKEALA